MNKYWVLHDGRPQGPYSAAEIVRLSCFYAEIPVRRADVPSSVWTRAADIGEIAAALGRPVPPPPPLSAPGKSPAQSRSREFLPALPDAPGPAAAAEIEARNEELARSVEILESRLGNLDKWLERREEIVNDVSKRILDFHGIFNKHLNTLRDQWDAERSQLRGTVEERVDRKVSQLEDALSKSGQIHSVLKEALSSLNQDWENYRAFILENVGQDLEIRAAKIKEEFTGKIDDRVKDLEATVKRRLEDFDRRVDSGMNSVLALEEELRRRRDRFNDLAGREEELNRSVEAVMRDTVALKDRLAREWGDSSARMESRAESLISRLEKSLRGTEELGEKLKDRFAEVRSGWEKDEALSVEKLKSDIETFKSELSDVKSAREEFREVMSKHSSELEKLELLYGQVSEHLKDSRWQLSRQKEELEAKAKETLSGMHASADAQVRDLQSQLAARLEESLKKAREDLEDITKAALSEKEKQQDYIRGQSAEFLELVKHKILLESEALEEERKKFQILSNKLLDAQETEAGKRLEAEISKARRNLTGRADMFSEELRKAAAELGVRGKVTIVESIRALMGNFDSDFEKEKGDIRRKIEQVVSGLDSEIETLKARADSRLKESGEKAEAAMSEKTLETLSGFDLVLKSYDGIFRNALETQSGLFLKELKAHAEAKRDEALCQIAPLWREFSDRMTGELENRLKDMRGRIEKEFKSSAAAHLKQAESSGGELIDEMRASINGYRDSAKNTAEEVSRNMLSESQKYMESLRKLHSGAAEKIQKDGCSCEEIQAETKKRAERKFLETLEQIRKQADSIISGKIETLAAQLRLEAGARYDTLFNELASLTAQVKPMDGVYEKFYNIQRKEEESAKKAEERLASLSACANKAAKDFQDRLKEFDTKMTAMQASLGAAPSSSEAAQNVSGELAELSKRMDILEERIAAKTLDLKTESVRREIPVIVAGSGGRMPESEPAAGPLYAATGFVKDNISLLVAITALLAALFALFAR